MKSIKEKAEEFNKVIRVINEHESIVNTQGSKIFIEGANYVLEQIEEIIRWDKDPHVIEALKERIWRLKQ